MYTPASTRDGAISGRLAATGEEPRGAVDVCETQRCEVLARER